MQVIYEIKRDALWFIGSLESCTQKNGPNLKDENGISLQSPFRSQGPKLREKKINQLLNLSKTDGQSVWLYAIKRDVLCFIGSKESCMQKKSKIQTQEMRNWYAS